MAEQKGRGRRESEGVILKLGRARNVEIYEGAGGSIMVYQTTGLCPNTKKFMRLNL